ncbi:unnamed protein product, partial [Protopolystoma xenopodis]
MKTLHNPRCRSHPLHLRAGNVDKSLSYCYAISLYLPEKPGIISASRHWSRQSVIHSTSRAINRCGNSSSSGNTNSASRRIRNTYTGASVSSHLHHHHYHHHHHFHYDQFYHPASRWVHLRHTSIGAMTYRSRLRPRPRPLLQPELHPPYPPTSRTRSPLSWLGGWTNRPSPPAAPVESRCSIFAVINPYHIRVNGEEPIRQPDSQQTSSTHGEAS